MLADAAKKQLVVSQAGKPVAIAPPTLLTPTNPIEEPMTKDREQTLKES